MRACRFGRTATICSIRDNGIALNAVESASASVTVGAITLTVRYSDGLRPVAGSNRYVNRPLESNRNPAPACRKTPENIMSLETESDFKSAGDFNGKILLIIESH
jgi:hypothetical protein